MHTLEIPNKGIRQEYASCLEELKPGEALFFVALYMKYLDKEIDGDEFRGELARVLLDIKVTKGYFYMLKRAEKDIKAEEWVENVNGNMVLIGYSLKSFFNHGDTEDTEPQPLKKGAITEQDDTGNTIPREPVEREQLKFDCIKQLVPRIGPFYGPGDALTDCSFWEYKEAHSAFVQFAETQDEKYLKKLVAILYRPKKKFLWLRKRLPNYDGQIRIKFSPKSNPLSLEKRIKKMKLCSYAQLYYVFLFFKACEEFLLHGRPTIDGKEINLSVLYEGAKGGTDDGIGLMGILFTLAETNVFGDIDKTADTGLYDVLSRLYQVTLQYKNINKPTKNDTDSEI